MLRDTRVVGFVLNKVHCSGSACSLIFQSDVDSLSRQDSIELITQLVRNSTDNRYGMCGSNKCVKYFRKSFRTLTYGV
jgi:hypothetical protein